MSGEILLESGAILLLESGAPLLLESAVDVQPQTGEEQALEHLAQERRREEFQRSLQAKLRAPAGPLVELKEKWKPVLESGEYPRR